MIQLLFRVQDQSPCQHSNSFFIGSPAWGLLRGQEAVTNSNLIDPSLCPLLLPWVLNLLDHESLDHGSTMQNFCYWITRVIVRGAYAAACEPWLWRKPAPYISHWFSGVSASRITNCCQPSSALKSLQMAYSRILSDWLLEDDGEHCKARECNVHEPITDLHLWCNEFLGKRWCCGEILSWWVSLLWIHGSFGKRITGREGKSVSRVPLIPISLF